MSGRKSHWEAVYQSKPLERVSWFRSHLEVSLELLARAGLRPNSRVIDVGSGASTLLAELLGQGVKNITAVDISATALKIAREQLGEADARRIQWIVSDITKLRLPAESIDIWHDRATLHFLSEPADVAAYVRVANEAIVKGGHAIIGGFAIDGPEECSGLRVVRRDPEHIADLFGGSFRLRESRREIHIAPSGARQAFAYALLRKCQASSLS